MLKLSKKIEYGLIAVRHMAVDSANHICTAKEISDKYKISYELLAKVLQKLTKEKIIISHQGMNGGYSLAKNAEEITVSHIITAIEGKFPGIVECFSEGPESCCISENCNIKNPLGKIQTNLERTFQTMKVSEMV